MNGNAAAGDSNIEVAGDKLQPPVGARLYLDTPQSEREYGAVLTPLKTGFHRLNNAEAWSLTEPVQARDRRKDVFEYECSQLQPLLG